ncbi:aldo/keto reductase [Candidatus Poribacteria bacterium]|nr:aldo/keto reductase [Candidatus Poribacteria bacterium]MBT5531512.1 aldo/keto reductase [Candidatus Poribacteria bacterium]MBT5712298.1 aldo/keto reductase [Candidatus Poribacteria bacterium]MBT7807927.1 aldo/keto reductase [Candidatus Poribacteria bacterium]
MEYRLVPGTDISVSEVGFGVWTLSAGWWGDYSDDEASALLNHAYDLGYTFFDTADTYGNGAGESILATAFGDRVNDIVVGTKFGYDIYGYGEARSRGQRELPQLWDPEYIRYACEQSLKRLGRDSIDLYQVHNIKFDSVMNDDIYDTLEALKGEGKVRAYGVAMGPANGWAIEGAAAMERRDISTVQLIHNLFEQHPGRALIDKARQTGKGVMVRVPHSSGLLEGHYTEDTTFAKTDHRRHRPRSWLVNGIKKMETVAFLTEGREGATMGQMALKWLLSEPHVLTTLPNIYNTEQIDDFAGTSDCVDVTSEEMRQLADLYAENFGIDEPVMDFKGVAADSEEARVLLSA